MAKEEHMKLSTFIKEIHNRLRQESLLYGPEEAWCRHMARTDDLKKYSKFMKELATDHWIQMNDPLHKNNFTHCRIQWIKRQCYEYYFKGKQRKYDEFENSIRTKFYPSLMANCSSTLTKNKAIDSSKIKILDVGSCYNPLGDDENFHVIPLDLSPYSDEVFKCDFLNVKIGKTIIINESREILQLEKSSFDVCVFSLLLEYLPSPEQRFHCCLQAYNLLKSSGLLIIITPDSKHVGANSKFMKSWRFVLSYLGFMRITYEKLKHLHCMTFRKCFNQCIASRWATIQNCLPKENILFSALDKIFIPQDFQKTQSINNNSEDVLCYTTDDILSGFEELPQLIE